MVVELTPAGEEFVSPLDEAVLAHLKAKAEGQVLDQDELMARYPQVAGELREFLDAEGAVATALAPWNRSVSPPPPDLVGSFGPYEFQRVISIKGGTAVILGCRDRVLNRPIAVKVLREEYAARPDAVRRFQEEAQIASQLQHPGIPPVHELGNLPDGRPYFSMKLVEGHDLATLLKQRPSPTHDLPLFLTVFQQVCQTVAYAHSKGVLHRDLKPLNIMVGAFGEVQVMDWGFGKVLKAPDDADSATLADDLPATPATTNQIQTIRSGLPGAESTPGRVAGTFAYMSPEQARGEVDRLDARCDVFSLGAILCEILTGQPPYIGQTKKSLREQACAAQLDPALARLEDTGMDAELLALAKSCLAAEKEGRPEHAGAVADAVTNYLNAIQQKLHAAEVQRARADAKAAEERKKRRWQLALAAAMLLLATGGVAGGAWYKFDREARKAARLLESVQADNRVMLAVKEADLLHADGRTAEALGAAQRAAALSQDERVSESEREGARELVAKLQIELTETERDSRFMNRVFEVFAPSELPTTASSGLLTQAPIDAQFAEDFREYGLEISNMSDDAILARLRSRPDLVRIEVAAILDAWALESRHRQRPVEFSQRLIRLARAIDPDPSRDQLRAILEAQQANQFLTEALAPVTAMIPDSDHNRLIKLADAVNPWQTPVLTVRLLGIGLLTVRENDRAVKLLRAAYQAHPDDVPLCWMLANVLNAASPSGWRDAIPYLQTARALRPELGGGLAYLLVRAGRPKEAEAVCQDMVVRQPTSALPPTYLAIVLRHQQRYSEAETASRRAISLQPKLAIAHTTLALALCAQKKLTEAEAAALEAVRLQPDMASARNNLGMVLLEQKRTADAVVALRMAISLEPNHAVVYSNLGLALLEQNKVAEAEAACRQAIRLGPDLAATHNNLGMVLMKQKKWAEAEAAFRMAISLEPDIAQAHSNLGLALLEQNNVTEAEAACRRAVRLQPELAAVHNNLGMVLMKQKKWAEAEAAFRMAISLEPDTTLAHSNLGLALLEQNKVSEAEAACRQAIRLGPDLAATHNNLGTVLMKQKKPNEAVAAFRMAISLEPDIAQAHSNLGLALLEQNNVTEAEAACRRAVRLQPELAAVHNNLGMVLMKQKKWAEAERLFRQAIQLEPEFAEAYRNLAGALQELNKLSEGEAACREAIRLRPDNMDYRVQLALVLADMKKWDEALAACRQAIELRPQDPTCHDILGHIYLDMEQTDKAITAFRKSIELNPNDSGRHAFLSWVYHISKRPTEALAEARKAVQLGPNDPRGHAALGAAFKAQGKLDEALSAYREAVRLRPDYVHYQSMVGHILGKMGKWEEAIGAYRRALERAPEDAFVFGGLGFALENSGKPAEAIAAYRKAIELEPNEVDPYIGLATALLDVGKPADAVVAFRKAMRLRPGNATTYNNLGLALLKSGQLAEAASALREAIRLNPDVENSYNNLGVTLIELGEVDEAIPCLRKAMDLNPKMANPHNHLGNAFLQQGKIQEAINELRTAVKLNPQYGSAYLHLGQALKRDGQLSEALAVFAQARKILPANDPDKSCAEREFQLSSRVIDLDGKLPDFLTGKTRPGSNEEQLAVAELCDLRGRHSAAVRFYADAFAAEPGRTNGLDDSYRFTAARSAALAAFGQDKDVAPDATTAERLRQQALEWLRADLAGSLKEFEKGKSLSSTQYAVRRRLRRWQTDTALASVRDKDALTKLSEAEQKAWQQFWTDVDALLQRAQSPSQQDAEKNAPPEKIGAAGADEIRLRY